MAAAVLLAAGAPAGTPESLGQGPDGPPNQQLSEPNELRSPNRQLPETSDQAVSDQAVSDSAGAEPPPFFVWPTGPPLYLLIAGGAVFLVVGIWIGRPTPGKLREDAEEIMATGTGRRERVRRRFTPAAWLQRNPSARSESRAFTVERPDRE